MARCIIHAPNGTGGKIGCDLLPRTHSAAQPGLSAIACSSQPGITEELWDPCVSERGVM